MTEALKQVMIKKEDCFELLYTINLKMEAMQAIVSKMTELGKE
jgi:hypothetical protein